MGGAEGAGKFKTDDRSAVRTPVARGPNPGMFVRQLIPLLQDGAKSASLSHCTRGRATAGGSDAVKSPTTKISICAAAETSPGRSSSAGKTG